MAAAPPDSTTPTTCCAAPRSPSTCTPAVPRRGYHRRRAAWFNGARCRLVRQDGQPQGDTMMLKLSLRYVGSAVSVLAARRLPRAGAWRPHTHAGSEGVLREVERFA